MSSSDSDRLLKLLSVKADGILTKEQEEELVALLSNSTEARKAYVSHMFLHAMMQRMAREVVDEPDLLPSSSDMDSARQQSVQDQDAISSRTPIIDFRGGAFQAGIGFLSRPLMLTLLLAIGLPGILFFVLVLHIMRQPVPLAPVATVTRTCECVWSDARAATPKGTAVYADKPIQLDGGLLEITYDSGATVLLEGPSRFKVINPGKGFLHSGQLVARVTKEAKGFSVSSPSATIVDLGTEFGMAVAKDGVTEAHVFQGEVEVVTRPANKHASPSTKRLRAGQAARIHGAVKSGSARIKLISARGMDFVQQIPGGENDVPDAAQGKMANRLIASVKRSGGVRSDKNSFDYCIGKFDGNTDPLPSKPSGLRTALRLYSDRPYLLKKVDKGLIGADYVRTYLHDKLDREQDCIYGVTLKTDHDDVFLIVLIDDRFGKKPGGLQRAVDKVVSKFAKPGTFIDTGLDVVFSNPEKERHSMSAFGKMVPTKDRFGKPIKYSLGAVPTRKIGFYSIAVMKKAPELKKEDGAAAGESAGKSGSQKTKR